MSLHIKRAYAPAQKSDGLRVLVDRLWPRGLRKEQAAIALWMKDIAPSPGLRAWFGHDPERFSEFWRLYQSELAGNEAEVSRLRDLVLQGPVTLIYAARDENCNHALVLADYLRRFMERRHGKPSA